MTIKDIAQRCGVSVSTVSRVLNNHPDVSDAVRTQIQGVIDAVHYVPNNSARDLVRSKSDAIGLVVRGVGNTFYTDVIQAIEHTTAEAGYALVLHHINSGEDEVAAGSGLVKSKKLQGVILLGGDSDYSTEKIAMLDVPFVCCSYTNSFGSLPAESYSSVSIDDYAEARRAVDLLIENGHRSIGILLNSTADRSIGQLRYRGYLDALKEAGIPVAGDLVEEIRGFGMKQAYGGAKCLMQRRPDMTAMFAIADSMAIAAIKALHDGGWKVPDDCSVIAIDGVEISGYSIPTLTTLSQPKKRMGDEAVKILVDMIEGRSGNRQHVLETTLRPGGSLGGIKVCI